MQSDTSESSAVIRSRVVRARNVQKKRFSKIDWVRCNSQMPSPIVHRFCRLSQKNQVLLQTAVERLGFSARAIERIIKVSRTIADLEGEKEIAPQHLGEAIQYRSFDRKVS